MVSFTIDQQKAIDAYGTNIINSAGAGSGKTAVLSEKVKEFIDKKHYKITDFLIVTFTRLAAGEMKQRIRKKLMDIDSPEAEFVDTADITTFDGFTLKIVKKYHYLLNVPSDISIIDTNVMNVKKRKFIDEIFLNEYQNPRKDFLLMLEQYGLSDDFNLKDLVFEIQKAASDEFIRT